MIFQHARRETFNAATNRSDNEMIIETDGCQVHLRVGLVDQWGRPVTRVDVVPDASGRGGDGQGAYWAAHPDDAPGVTRVVRYRSAEQFPKGQPPAVPVELTATWGHMRNLADDVTNGVNLTPEQLTEAAHQFAGMFAEVDKLAGARVLGTKN